MERDSSSPVGCSEADRRVSTPTFDAPTENASACIRVSPAATPEKTHAAVLTTPTRTTRHRRDGLVLNASSKRRRLQAEQDGTAPLAASALYGSCRRLNYEGSRDDSDEDTSNDSNDDDDDDGRELRQMQHGTLLRKIQRLNYNAPGHDQLLHSSVPAKLFEYVKEGHDVVAQTSSLVSASPVQTPTEKGSDGAGAGEGWKYRGSGCVKVNLKR